jgi:hypothetical protein
VQEWTKVLLGRDVLQAEMDSMPGLLLPRVTHIGEKGGTGAFHQILRQRLPSGSTQDVTVILRELEATYADWDAELGPLVWKAAREWLRLKGVS